MSSYLAHLPRLLYLPRMTHVLQVPDAMAEIMKLGDFGSGIDTTYDQLRLIGAIIGLVTLLQTATYSADDKARIAAAKTLVDIKEDPADIVERLRAAPFAKFSINALEYVVQQLSAGRTNLQDIYVEAEAIEADLEADRERTSTS